MDDLARLTGERLRAARRERGLSLGALAEAAHVGKGSLSEIENGVRNPTLGTLYALAGALGVPLATLLADRPGVRVASPGIEARLLDVSRDAGHDGGHAGGRDAGQAVEVYRLRIEAGHGHRSPAHGPGVTEHLLVTSGRARVGRLGEETEIGPGQAAQWASDVPHGYAALGSEPVESVLVIRSPANADLKRLAGEFRLRGEYWGLWCTKASPKPQVSRLTGAPGDCEHDGIGVFSHGGWCPRAGNG